MWNDEEEPTRDADVARLEAMLQEGLRRRDVPEGLQERIVARALTAREETVREGTVREGAVREGAARATALLGKEPRRTNVRRDMSGRRIGGRLLRFPLEGRRWAVQRIAASVLLGVMVAGAAAYFQAEQRRREQRAEEARAQVMEALRITSQTLDKVQTQLRNGE